MVTIFVLVQLKTVMSKQFGILCKSGSIYIHVVVYYIMFMSCICAAVSLQTWNNKNNTTWDKTLWRTWLVCYYRFHSPDSSGWSLVHSVSWFLSKAKVNVAVINFWSQALLILWLKVTKNFLLYRVYHALGGLQWLTAFAFWWINTTTLQ